ncbi:MAG: hypoxanthine phosphoribosyltransferase [Firmicutes bacterium]|nr:hypoxanthine phosphoribosyltransferase [Bacillota bacterium]
MKESISILISEEAIRKRVAEMAEQINKDYNKERLTLVCALKGAIIFMADLSRKLDAFVDFDFISASSYGDSATSSGKVQIVKDMELDAAGRHILLIEDILDTGNTIKTLRKHILSKNPESLKVCSLLDKPERRMVAGIEADYTGFTIPDKFVVGYGLDYAQRYRNLPYIGVLNIGEE